MVMLNNDVFASKGKNPGKIVDSQCCEVTMLRSSKSAGCISQFLKILVYVHGSSLFSLPQGFTCAVCSSCAQAVLVSCPLGLAFIAVMAEDLLC